jgi:hypothetical protein
VGDWKTDHPGQTISQCVASQETKLADHATELADHEKRITALEGDNATNKQEIADIKAKNTAQDTAISGNTDSITHLETDKADKTALGDYVTKTEFNADQKRQDDIVGDWETDHPGQTISQCVTSQETKLADHAASIAKLKTDNVAVDELFQTSVVFPKVEITKMNTGVSYVEEASVVICDINLPFLRKEKTSATATVTVNYEKNAEVVYFDGTTETIPGSAVSVSGEFGAGFVRLRAIISTTRIPNIAVGKPFVLRIPLDVTVSTTVS